MAFSVNARIEHHMWGFPMILAEAGRMGYDPKPYSMDLIRSSVDKAIASTFVEHDELREAIIKLNNQQEEGN